MDYILIIDDELVLEPITGIRIDFIFSFSAYEKQALKRINRVNIGKAQVCFASVEDMVIHKIVAL